MQTLLDAGQIERTLSDMAKTIFADPLFQNAPQAATLPIALVGIRSRGEIMAQRLAKILSVLLTQQSSTTHCPHIDVGALDITFYRDDLASRHAITIPQGTDMNFRLDDRPVILIDDVLATGRSIRSALDALVDFGRPRLIRVAALIDRGVREYPISADFVGLRVPPAQAAQHVIVHLKPTDPEDTVYIQ